MPSAGNPQSLNRYAYTLNNPVRYTDPTGHCINPIDCVKWIGRISAAVQGIIVGKIAYDNWAGSYFGNLPDFRGLTVAESYKVEIAAASSNTGVSEIAIAAGIAVQSQWCCGLSDWVEVNIVRDTNPSQGIAQLTPGESELFPEGKYKPFDAAPSAEAMGKKMQGAANQCVGCSPTDKFIAMAIGQNGFTIDPREIPFTQSGKKDWAAYFSEATKKQTGRIDTVIRRMAQGVESWDQMQLILFLHDLEGLMAQGWELPEGIDINYTKCVASDSGNCD